MFIEDCLQVVENIWFSISVPTVVIHHCFLTMLFCSIEETWGIWQEFYYLCQEFNEWISVVECEVAAALAEDAEANVDSVLIMVRIILPLVWHQWWIIILSYHLI